MTVYLYYFALLQDQRGLPGEKLDIEPQSVDQLYQTLKSRHGFTLERNALRISVNKAFVTWETDLQDGDEVVFIPPVSGG